MLDRITIIYQAFLAFLNWWVGELAAMVPSRLKDFFEGERLENKLIFARDKIEIEFVKDGKTHRRSFDGAWQKSIKNEAFTSFTAENLSGFCSVYLSDDLFLSRDVELPKAAKDEYRNAIRFQLGKLLPLSTDKMHYDCHLLDQSDHPDFIKIALAMVKKTITDDIISVIEHAGLSIKSIRSAQGQKYAHSFEFLNLEHKFKARNRIVIGGLVTTCVALLLLCGFALDHKYSAREDYLLSQMTLLSERSRQVTALFDQVETLKQQIALSNERSRKIRLDHVLETLTSEIPENSWIYDYRQAGRKLTLVGVSTNSSAIVDRLAENSMFDGLANNARRAGEEGTEQFTITMKLARKENGGDDD